MPCCVLLKLVFEALQLTPTHHHVACACSTKYARVSPCSQEVCVLKSHTPEIPADTGGTNPTLSATQADPSNTASRCASQAHCGGGAKSEKGALPAGVSPPLEAETVQSIIIPWNRKPHKFMQRPLRVYWLTRPSSTLQAHCGGVAKVKGSHHQLACAFRSMPAEACHSVPKCHMIWTSRFNMLAGARAAPTPQPCRVCVFCASQAHGGGVAESQGRALPAGLCLCL